MKNKFSNKVHMSLQEKRNASLRILLEKDDDSNDSESKENDSSDKNSSDPFEMSSDEEENDTNSDESDDNEDEKDKKEVKGVTQSQFDEMIKSIDLIQRTIDKATSKDGSQNIEHYMQGFVVPKDSKDIDHEEDDRQTESYERIIQQKIFEISQKLNSKSIKRFLFESDADIEEVEANLDDLDRILSKGNAIVDKFKKGNEIDIASYVEGAINAFRNFDNLFSKEMIVKQASINVLILNSGARAEENVKQFEERFHEELYKNFGIEYEDHMVKTVDYQAASGAKAST